MRTPYKVLTLSIAIVAAMAGLTAQTGDAPTLKDPATLVSPAPDQYRVRFDTSKGEFVVEVNKAWAPRGATRFYNLVKNGFYNDNRFFRVLGSIAQFGLHGDPAIARVWQGAIIIDDAPKQMNERGYLSFAAGGPNTRTTQVFINLGDNRSLSTFAPFGRIVSGMNVLEDLYKDYGDKPEQTKIRAEGNAYLAKEFPRLDYIKTATIVEP